MICTCVGAPVLVSNAGVRLACHISSGVRSYDVVMFHFATLHAVHILLENWLA